MANEIIEPKAIAYNGWKFYSKCRCNGVLKHKYRNADHPDLELEWWVRYAKFRVTYRGTQSKIPVTKISLLEETLLEL